MGTAFGDGAKMSDIISKIPSSMLVNDTADAAQVNKALLNQVQGSNKIIDAVNTVNAAVTAVGSGIVELGTNSNGTYIKWGNGLMVQHGWTYGSTSATTQAFDITVTLPSTMNGTEFDIFSSFLGYKSISSGVPASRVDISGSIGAEHTAGARPLTSSTASLRVSSAGSGSNINTTLYYMISWASIGMWK